MVGLPLSQVLVLLEGRKIAILETSPPRAPRHYTPIWGEKRVVRMREKKDESLELVVAPELLREEKAP